MLLRRDGPQISWPTSEVFKQRLVLSSPVCVRHLRRLFGVGYREDIGFITKGASLSNSVALGLLKQLYPDFKRQKSGQADILLYLDKPNGSWSIDGNEDDRFVSIGKNDDVDFAAALESLNQTTPVCQITPPPPSQEDLDQDSTLVYKSNASFQAVFQASTKRKWYLDKREQLELQLAYLGLIYLKAQDELFVSKPLDAKRVELAQIVPRLVAFAGFSSFDSYEDIKEELVNSIVEAKFPLLWIFFQSGRLVFVYSRSAGAEIMQQKMDISEIKDMIKDMVRQIKDIAERSSIN